MSENGQENQGGQANAGNQGGVNQKAPRPAKDSHGSSRKKPEPLNEDRCLSALVQIPGMLLRGMISNNQASVIRGCYGTALQHLRQSRAGKTAPVVEQADMNELLRQHPTLINSLADILPQDQFDELVKEIQGETGESA